MNRKAHWKRIYTAHSPREVSLYQAHPSLSLRLIQSLGIGKTAGLIDVGGGASTLVDHLLEAGFTKLAVLDISGEAIRHAKTRLGEEAEKVAWYEVDVTAFQPPRGFVLWHDRAVFHFLTDEADRKQYVRALKDTVMPGGHVIIATFAIEGPTRCSGLEVRRYDARSICAGDGFALLEAINETHTTPGNVSQRFTYFVFRKRAP